MAHRIFINDYAGYPFIVQLSRELSQRGHEVLHVVAGYNTTPKGILVKQPEDPNTFAVKALFTKQPLQKYNFFRRWMQEREYGELLLTEINEFQPDVVLSADNPLDAQEMLLRDCRTRNIRFIYWLQDLIGIATSRLLKRRLPVLGYIIGSYYMKLEQKLLNLSDHIVIISDDFESFLNHWNITEQRMTVIPNWAPVENISPQLKSNAWSRSYQLDDKFCYLYTGTLGMKHNPALLLDLAEHFCINSNVRIVVVSEGPGADWLRMKKQELGLYNLVLLGYQPFEDLQFVLGAADVTVAILESEAGIFSVPSKVLSYLCAQRPLLVSFPLQNYSAKILCESSAGIVVDPQDSRGFINSAERLWQDKKLRENLALNGRKYAEMNFDIKRIADRFEQIL